MNTLSYQTYRYERGLTTAEQRAADIRAGEAAAAVRDLRLRIGRALRLARRARLDRGAPDAMTAPARLLP